MSMTDSVSTADGHARQWHTRLPCLLLQLVQL